MLRRAFNPRFSRVPSAWTSDVFNMSKQFDLVNTSRFEQRVAGILLQHGVQCPKETNDGVSKIVDKMCGPNVNAETKRQIELEINEAAKYNQFDDCMDFFKAVVPLFLAALGTFAVTRVVFEFVCKK